jgi:hypothetical protein
VDDEEVEDEQPGQEHRMVLARHNRVLVALDQVVDGASEPRPKSIALSRVTTWAGTIPMSASRSAKLRKEPPTKLAKQPNPSAP